MPKFEVNHKTPMNTQEAFEKLDQFMQNAGEIKKWDSQAVWQSDLNSKTAKIKGKQFTANILVKELPGSGSEVVFQIDIPLLLTPLKGKISEVLKHKLEKYLV